MLGNAWHLPTAIWLLFLLLIPTTAHIPQTPKITALDQMTQAWLNNPLPFGPPQDVHQRQHATARLAIPPEMGQITSRLVLLPKTN